MIISFFVFWVRPTEFEPAACGFEVRIPEFPNLLKSLQPIEIVRYEFPRGSRFFLILADFGTFFSHRFSHSFKICNVYW